ncbi:hypothetical protein DACRYDRAFT_111429 [Dacryopinax primogenitus]|uniref:Fungal-type protein kinase domain-containing protein n=1 Tax=Dacryopinax primogenitus (strain DJM 731) TaxID=1858805 RepID=M5FNT6_DACPD|nr:uncharacterized protein DACRYDRAFT_111429 [Dacryopinax primogenitus]EJT97910.1 hypothetical protein DACRYDRAFT_111429 [Dacryopinax primogenitus]
MAAEKIASRWMYLPRDAVRHKRRQAYKNRDPFGQTITHTVAPQEGQVASEPPEFWNTPLHDPEDLYWVAVYKLLHSVPAANPVPAPRQVHTRNLLFGYGNASNDRKEFMSFGRLSEPLKTPATDPEMVPAAFLPWWLVLKEIGAVIARAHYDCEEEWNNDTFYPNLQDICSLFVELVNTMRTDLEIADYPDPKEDAAPTHPSIPGSESPSQGRATKKRRTNKE